MGNNDRFDSLTKAMSSKMSRGSALKGFGALLAGTGLASVGGGSVFAANYGNSACAHYCNAVYGEGTPEQSICASNAAHSTGECYACGPAGAGGGNCNVGFNQCPGTSLNGSNLGCYCFTTIEGLGVCGANTYCSQSASCASSADCGPGSVCITANGCNNCGTDTGVCVQLCSQSSTGAAAPYASAPVGMTAIG